MSATMVKLGIATGHAMQILQSLSIATGHKMQFQIDLRYSDIKPYTSTSAMVILYKNVTIGGQLRNYANPQLETTTKIPVDMFA